MKKMKVGKPGYQKSSPNILKKFPKLFGELFQKLGNFFKDWGIFSQIGEHLKVKKCNKRWGTYLCNIIEIHKDRYINYVIFAIERISGKIGDLLQTLDHLFKNWGTFSKIGELFKKLGIISKWRSFTKDEEHI